MDVLIFVVSVVFLLFTRKMYVPLLGLLILGNNYLGIGGFFKLNNLNVFDPKDLGIVLMVLILLVTTTGSRFKQLPKGPEVKKVNKYIVFFLGYIILITFVDLIYNGIDFWSILRTSRHWLMLLMFIPLISIPVEQLEKTIKGLYYITIIVSLIIVIEFLTGTNYFTEEAYERYVANHTITRGALPSTYALFYVLMVAMGYGQHKKYVRYTILALLTFSLLLSATKSIALGLFLGLVILVYLKSKSNMAATGRILLVSVLALSVVALLPDLRYRLTEGRTNFGSEDDGSSTYRMLLAEERFNYIAQDPVTLLFGIGNVTEDNYRGNFQVGLRTEDGGITQLDTGDIAWALTFIRLGLLGTLLWVGLSLFFVWGGSRRKYEQYAIPLISFLLLNLLVLSTAGTSCYQGVYWVVPLICLNIISANKHISLKL